ncbi:MAG: NTP transferase domain-containing protein [Polyangiaceae bacterium]
MLIFVPMAGFGDRYIRAGYTQPKPLIPVDGKPMIEHVIDCFPGEARFLFCVNASHAKETPVLDVLKRLKPGAPIVVMENHKDGPIRTLLACEEHIDPEEEVVLNYCDFGVDWDYADFKRWLADGKWDAAMTAYRGFHPHSLGPTLYAYMRSEGDRVLEIREKHHFTANKFDEYASSGLYYFRRGGDMIRAAKKLIERGERVNNEFYVSMAIQVLIEEGKKTGVYPLKHFYQWGTPDDLRDWEGWASGMRALDGFYAAARKTRSRAAHVIPMAGRGQRFADRGYTDPKPHIDTAGAPMIAQALACLPVPSQRVLVAQREHAEDARFKKTVAELPSPTRIIELDRVTEGQACTAALGIEGLPADQPVLFAPCDTGYVYDVEALQKLEASGDYDLVVFAAKGHLPAIWRPQMYGWMEVGADRNVRRVAVKKLVDGVPANEQQVVTGTFLFKDVATYQREYDALLAANDRVNNEFYIDTIARRMVESGKRVIAFTVDKYMPWGTPEELQTFQYWNDVFRGGKVVGTAIGH